MPISLLALPASSNKSQLIVAQSNITPIQRETRPVCFTMQWLEIRKIWPCYIWKCVVYYVLAKYIKWSTHVRGIRFWKFYLFVFMPCFVVSVRTLTKKNIEASKNITMKYVWIKLIYVIVWFFLSIWHLSYYCHKKKLNETIMPRIYFYQYNFLLKIKKIYIAILVLLIFINYDILCPSISLSMTSYMKFILRLCGFFLLNYISTSRATKVKRRDRNQYKWKYTNEVLYMDV